MFVLCEIHNLQLKMKIFNKIADLRAYLHECRAKNQKIGFVPTMGALHEGHLALVQCAKSETEIAVCSIYVNPTQFNNPADLEKYPRTLENDIKLLETVFCDVLFVPENAEMYPEKNILKFDFGTLETVMEGRFRLGHFNGMATIVCKLFNIIQPNKAYFGQKDLQQYRIVRQFIADLSFPIDLICYPIVREKDGLAMSSRNKRLTPTQREIAPKLYEALLMAQKAIQSQDENSPKTILKIKEEILLFLENIEGIKVEYFEIVAQNTLISLDDFTTFSGNNLYNNSEKTGIALCIAAFLGEIRLIDNLLL